MILVIDNFDSFVQNLARYLRQLGQETLIVRNDDARLDDLSQINPRLLVISPGPGRPVQTGKCLPIINAWRGKIPMVGVCLGHQCIVESYGGQIIRARQPMHGRNSPVAHQGHSMFDEIPRQFDVCRYHSLVAARESLPANLYVTAETAEGEVMAVADDRQRVYGIQFHPEATLTRYGYRLLANLLSICGLPVDWTQISTLQNSIDQEQQVGTI